MRDLILVIVFAVMTWTLANNCLLGVNISTNEQAIKDLQKELKDQALKYEQDILELRKNQSSLAGGILDIWKGTGGYINEVETESVEK